MSLDRDALLARVELTDDWHGADESPPGDPWSVHARMSMYRQLVEQVNGHGAFGDFHELSPFWGYASQLVWQRRSGRLGDATDVIAPSSWWGACNFSLSVVPYLAASDAGLVTRLRGTEVVLADSPVYAAARLAWRGAMATLGSLRRGDELEPARFAMWRAHLASIHAAIAAHESDFARMPPAERRFALGWLRMVELFGAAATRTDLVALAKGGPSTLPSRVLDDDLSGLPRQQQSTARRVSALADRPEWRWTVERYLWKRIVRSGAAREDVDGILVGLFGRGSRVWQARVRALAYAALPLPVIDGARRRGHFRASAR